MSTTKKKLETGLVRELAAILREADLGEIEIEHEGLRIRVKKPETATVAHVAAPPAQTAPATAVGASPEAAPAQASSVPENAITSPMVGTAYLSPEPGAKVFVNVGDKVKKGDTLMLVEAMKTFNPVTAPAAGTVEAILISDAQPVEFGEPLIVIS